MTGNPQITFVSCLESGWLEDQTVWMIESLRRWGGQLANSSMIAVTLRVGFPLSHKTHIEEKLKAARVLHYHDSMWPSFCSEFIKSLCTTHQPVANWLDSLGLIEKRGSCSLAYYKPIPQEIQSTTRISLQGVVPSNLRSERL